MQVRSGEIEPADFIHPGGQPEKSFGPENTSQVFLQEIPETRGMKRPSRLVGERCGLFTPEISGALFVVGNRRSSLR